jgi:hypothetical protein
MGKPATLVAESSGGAASTLLALGATDSGPGGPFKFNPSYSDAQLKGSDPLVLSAVTLEKLESSQYAVEKGGIEYLHERKIRVLSLTKGDRRYTPDPMAAATAQDKQRKAGQIGPKDFGFWAHYRYKLHNADEGGRGNLCFSVLQPLIIANSPTDAAIALFFINGGQAMLAHTRFDHEYLDGILRPAEAGSTLDGNALMEFLRAMFGAKAAETILRRTYKAWHKVITSSIKKPYNNIARCKVQLWRDLTGYLLSCKEDWCVRLAEAIKKPHSQHRKIKGEVWHALGFAQDVEEHGEDDGFDPEIVASDVE